MAVRGDNPIRTPNEDALGRTATAQQFARHVLALDATEGVVVGVLGPWGSGKTSFINLARSEFERQSTAMLEFNPWMFSGTEQLVESFFSELAAQLKLRIGLEAIANDLEQYGEAFSGLGWVPVVGTWIERIRGTIKIVSKISRRGKDSVGARRAKLQKALSDFGRPIIVLLDDIDRLSTTEIRHVFKLVRLTASFPNIIYIVAFDRDRVEEALTETNVSGRVYLEKILQIAIDLPPVPDRMFSRMIATSIETALSDIERPGPFDEGVWPDLFAEIVRPLVRNGRDVRRYAASLRGTVQALEGQVALADLLSLEAVRVLLPDVFSRLHGAIEGLTTTSGFLGGGRDDPPRLKKQIESLVKAGGPHSELVKSMIKQLFPAGQRHINGSHYGSDWKGRWRRERRVAHEDILRLYLERVAGESLQAFAEAEQAWAHFSDRSLLDRHLRSIDPERLQDVISSFEVFEDQFRPDHVVAGTIVLLNLLPELPKRERGMFELDARFTVTRVTYRLLKSLSDPCAVEAAVRQILPELTTLSSKLELISQIGHRQGAGHKLVSQEAAEDFEKSWRTEVRTWPTENLAQEWDLARVLFHAKSDATPTEPPLNVPTSPELTLALLRAVRTETLSQTMGSRTVRRSPRLAWDVLIQVYGDESTLKARIDDLKSKNLGGASEVLELAQKYLSGWRPTQFEED